MVTGAQAAGNRQPVLIIDAGHGGLDGGASSADGRIESAINLQIAQDLEFLARLFGEKTVMTRTENELHYPDDAMTVKEKKLWDQNTRIALINSVEQGVLISIHQNKFPDTRPHGTQVLFAPTDGSMEFGKLTHDMLITTLNPENRRVASPISEKIYLMKNINCPAILVECGFLSNLTEVERLSDATYQFQIAAVLFASYLQYTSV